MAGLLIVTCGTTDIQFVARSSAGDVFRLAGSRLQQRSLHELLLDGRLPYIVDRAAEAIGTHQDLQVGLVDGQPAIHSTGADWNPATMLELDRPLKLVPAKLAGLPDLLHGEAKPDTVIVFNTHRDIDANEPIAAGWILSRWLANEFGLETTRKAGEIRKGAACWVNFLDGTMLAEGLDGGPVNLAAMQRIDDALSSLDGRWKMVTLAIMGGLPSYRDQIRALARFRFRRANVFDYVQPLRQPGHVERQPDGRLPSDSYRLRHEVRTKIRKGDFVAAATVARQGWAPSRTTWGEPVAQAAAYLNGMLENADALPDYLKDLVRPDVPRCLLPAMRVEAALRVDRLPEAVLWTFAFFDAALVDGIAALPFVAEFNELTRTVDVTEDETAVPEELLVVQPNRPTCLSRDDGRAGRPPNGLRRLRYQTGSLVNRTWLRNLGEIGVHLSRFDRRLSDQNGLEPKSLRNVIMHSSLPAGLMAGLRERFTALGIWNGHVTPNGFFLGQSEVAAIVTGLGMEHPARLHDRLVEGLCTTVETARLR